MKLSAEEQENIRQTIEAFEQITRANPEDCHSLEVLKEAYFQAERPEDAARTMRQLADTYAKLGQYSSALLEYEGLLQRDPESVEIKELLQKTEDMLTSKVFHGGNKSFSDALGGRATGLIETHETDGRNITGAMPVLKDDGNDLLVKFLVQNKLAPVDLVHSSLAKVRRANKAAGAQHVALSLIEEIAKSESENITEETLLSEMVERANAAYIPLEYYDIERNIVKMLPQELTLGRLIVPFDTVSRTLMVAMANPFDNSGKAAAQRMVDYNIEWYLASPTVLSKVLRDAYRLPQSQQPAPQVQPA